MHAFAQRELGDLVRTEAARVSRLGPGLDEVGGAWAAKLDEHPHQALAASSRIRGCGASMTTKWATSLSVEQSESVSETSLSPLCVSPTEAHAQSESLLLPTSKSEGSEEGYPYESYPSVEQLLSSESALATMRAASLPPQHTWLALA